MNNCLVAAAVAAAAICFAALQTTDATCYGANTSTWGCQGYQKVGYTCVGNECAIDHCVGDCTVCAKFYPELVVNPGRGQCCTTASGSDCMSGDSGFTNYPYGFPDHVPSLVVEYPVSYPGGPVADGFTANYPGSQTDAGCPPVPSFYSAKAKRMLKPISLIQHGVPSAVCALACNTANVTATGYDPCEDGRITQPVNETPRCFFGGPTFLQPETGICGFPCFVHEINGTKYMFCDPRQASE